MPTNRSVYRGCFDGGIIRNTYGWTDMTQEGVGGREAFSAPNTEGEVVQILRRAKGPLRVSSFGLVLVGLLMLGITACRSPHQPTARRMDPAMHDGWPRGNNFFRQASLRRLQVDPPTIPNAEYVNDDELCMTCHEAYAKSFHERNVHRNNSCEDCHGPASRHLISRGLEPQTTLSFRKLAPAQAAEVCLKCHEENACSPGGMWRHSTHAHKGVTCTDCHRNHYDVPPGTPATPDVDQVARFDVDRFVQLAGYRAAAGRQPENAELPSLRGTSRSLGAVAPQVCYQCHGDMAELQTIAGPHQIGGEHGFNCTTCHDAHGNIIEYGRTELCLQCHTQDSPTMAWHSSTHSMHGVACTDCHHPHPGACVSKTVSIDRGNIRRPRRRAMSVQEPEACYKCHQNIFALTNLPSRHPIQEGKMVCSDCHDPHGQSEGGLKEDSINQVCWTCHAEFQGPFAYEHPPVTENCAYCHEPHGTVEKKLLRKPVTFLCLQCHSGHRGGGPTGPPHATAQRFPDLAATGGAGSAVDLIGQQGKENLQAAFFQDCTLCHSQVHGSDVPTPRHPGTFMR